MAMSSRELVRRTITFQGVDRLAMNLPEEYGNDFAWVGMTPSVDARPRSGRDEWGAVWQNMGTTNLGEVKEFPLKDWADFDQLNIPNIHDPARWTTLEGARERAGDKFLLGSGVSIYERVHFIRGLENTWMDIFDHPRELEHLLDLLVEMNLVAIEKYAAASVDGYMWADDWGLQNRLMISPKMWRIFWKPRYERIYRAAHDAGMLTFLHSCGYIINILGDLIDIGLDVIQMDQQENMGLEELSQFAGKIAFLNPVDIQQTMAHGSLDEIRTYCWKMTRLLGTPQGGYMAQWYGDPAGAGHTDEAIAVMCTEFLKISGKMGTAEGRKEIWNM